MSLSFSQRLGLRVGIEELTEGATGDEDLGEAGGTVVLPDEPTETVEGGLDESQTAEAEVTEVTAEAEQVERTVETMEKIAAGLSVAMRNGGCTAGEAYAYQVALESAFGPFGMGPSASASLENIGSAKNPRLEATRITLEGLTDNLKKWWDGLMAIWDKVYTAVKGWLMKVFDGLPALKKRASELKIKVGGLAKSAAHKPQKDKITFTVSKIATGKVAPDGKTVAASITKVSDLVAAQVSTAKGTEAASIEALTDALTTLAKDISSAGEGKEGEAKSAEVKAAEKKAIESIIGTADGYATGLKAANKDKYGGDGLTAKITEPYPGNKVVLVTMPENIEKDGKVIDLDVAVKAFGLKITDGEAASEETEMPAPEANELVTIVDNVIKVIEIAEKHRENWRDRETVKGKLAKAIKTEVDAVSKKDNAGLATTTKKIGSAIQSYTAKTANYEAQVVSYATRVCQVAMDYANKGAENYGTGETKSADDKK